MTVGYGYRPGRIKIIFDGQSFNFTPNDAQSYPTKLMALLPDVYYHDIVAVSGTPYATRATLVGARFTPRIPIVDTCIMLDAGGTTDLYNGAGGLNLTAAQALSAMESYWDARRASGVDKIIAATVPPSTAFNADDETQRVALNTSIRASVKLDAVADIAALAHSLNAADATYYYDGTHPTDALSTEWAAVYQTALATLGFPT